MLTSQHKHFLAGRLKAACRQQPELKALQRLLLRLGGEFLVAPPKPDTDLSAVLDCGFVMAGPITLKLMERNGCHQNVAALWGNKKTSLVGIGTGYTLSEDGLWRQHSWGVLREGILETTIERLKYFGVILQGRQAEKFVRTNQP